MSRTKNFTLFFSYEEGHATEIQCRVYRDGTFKSKGTLIHRNDRLIHAKRSAKKRGFGFHLISLIHDGLGYHHVNKNDVVCIPMDIHKACSHNHLDGSALKLEGVTG